MIIVKPNCFEKTKVRWGIFKKLSPTKLHSERSAPLAANGLRLCVRLRSVGIERSGSLHKTAVISWLRLIKRELNLKREQKEFEKRSDGNKQNI